MPRLLALSQVACQLAFPREEAHLRAYLSGEDPSLTELFPELATFRDLVYITKVMMAPHAEHLPEMRAWTAADARLTWRWKDGESKDDTSTGKSDKNG